MRKDLREFRNRTLSRPDVRREYDRLADEFAFLDQILKARADAGLTQAEVASRIGTTQSAIARLETGGGKHSPSMATLQRYATALGYKVRVQLVKEPAPAAARSRQPRRRAA
jgi:transcriptional regulator with XRE-family HTH domain